MSREPMILVHGFSGTWEAWEPLLPALEREHDVLAVKLAGHCGGEDLPDPSTTALADAIERDMDRAGYETAHLVGNSLGGWMALELAKRGRARSVVALSPGGGWEEDSREAKRVQAFFRRTYWSLKVGGPSADFLARRPRLRRFALRDVMARPERVPPRAAAAMIRGAAGCPAFLPLLKAIGRDGPPKDFRSIDVPIRIAWGTDDRILRYPAYWEPLRRILPASAELVEMPGLGHVPMWDDPDLVARTVLEVTARRPVAA
ncbi:MAG TPA: alpha/beta hydrolase [Solirubrobacteraceae bacterium]|jgi:pimeloyl-ACP methyl ester carboxylesterase